MQVNVEINEGGRFVKTEKMTVRKVKDFSDVTIYENEDGKAVVYLKHRDKYILISNEMA